MQLQNNPSAALISRLRFNAPLSRPNSSTKKFKSFINVTIKKYQSPVLYQSFLGLVSNFVFSFYRKMHCVIIITKVFLFCLFVFLVCYSAINVSVSNYTHVTQDYVFC